MKYRKLKRGEVMKRGDEMKFLGVHWDKIEFRDCGFGKKWSNAYWPVRRPIKDRK